MDLKLQEMLPTNISGATYGVIGLVAAITLSVKLSQAPNLDGFPTLGSNTWIGSWWSSFRYLKDAASVIQEGYIKYKSAPFKIAEPQRWTVIISNREHIEEIAKAPEHVLSSVEAVNDQIDCEHIMAPEILHNPYHVGLLLSRLTRNARALYPEIRDEIVSSFADILDLKGNEWKSIQVLGAIEKIVCRTSNRIFVGLPLCRNPEWIDLTIRTSMDTFKGGIMVGLFPRFMKPLIARLTNVPRDIAQALKLLGPIIKERQEHLDEYGSTWNDKPNDLLSWLMEEAEGPELLPERLILRILVSNNAAIHTSSNSFTQALLYLAAHPQYIQPLREEVESIVKQDGWSHESVVKMRKVNSFLKECQRVGGITSVTIARKALQDFTFSDSTFIPAGTTIAAASRSRHYDPRIYKDPETFMPFQFVTMGEESGGSAKYQYASTSVDYLSFGHGRQACPGRFFAANELKSMLAHIAVTYDVKLEDGATRPPNWNIGYMISADPRAKIMFRNRLD